MHPLRILAILPLAAGLNVQETPVSRPADPSGVVERSRAAWAFHCAEEGGRPVAGIIKAFRDLEGAIAFAKSTAQREQGYLTLVAIAECLSSGRYNRPEYINQKWRYRFALYNLDRTNPEHALALARSLRVRDRLDVLTEAARAHPGDPLLNMTHQLSALVVGVPNIDREAVIRGLTALELADLRVLLLNQVLSDAFEEGCSVPQGEALSKELVSLQARDVGEDRLECAGTKDLTKKRVCALVQEMVRGLSCKP